MESLLADTIEITQAAGSAIMEYYRSSFDVADKKPDNPVTDADLAADRLLKELLLRLLPDAGWLSEETADDHVRLGRRRVWVVDPLDGTKEFVMGIPEFAVSVALVEEGQPVIGVVFNPPTGELFAARKGGGASYNGGRTVASARRQFKGARVDASRSERNRGEFRPFEEQVELRTVGSIAYKLARIASGQSDATWSRGPKNEWDICAGVLLVREAGGMSVDLDDGDFLFNRPGTLVNGIIADNGLIHQQLLAALAPYRHLARR